MQLGFPMHRSVVLMDSTRPLAPQVGPRQEATRLIKNLVLWLHWDVRRPVQHS